MSLEDYKPGRTGKRSVSNSLSQSLHALLPPKERKDYGGQGKPIPLPSNRAKMSAILPYTPGEKSSSGEASLNNAIQRRLSKKKVF